jgi:hypothetical protein
MRARGCRIDELVLRRVRLALRARRGAQDHGRRRVMQQAQAGRTQQGADHLAAPARTHHDELCTGGMTLDSPASPSDLDGTSHADVWPAVRDWSHDVREA